MEYIVFRDFDFVLILVLYYGFKGGVMSGQLGGFVGGFWEDILGGRDFGVSMLVNTFLGFLAGSLCQKLYAENSIKVFLLVGAGVILKKSIFILILGILEAEVRILDHFMEGSDLRFLMRIGLNGLVGVLIFKLLNRVNLDAG